MYAKVPGLLVPNILVAWWRKTPFMRIEYLFLIKPNKMTKKETKRTIAIIVLPGASQK